MNNQPNQNNNQNNFNNNYVNGTSNQQFNQSDLMQPMESQVQQNSQNGSTNQVNQQNLYNNNPSANISSNYVQNNQNAPITPNNVSNSNNKSFFQENKKKIIIGVCILIVLLLLLSMCSRKGSSMNNGYTATEGDTIKINEIVDKFDVKITSPIEKSVIEDSALFDDDCLKIGISVNNLSKDKLELSTVNMFLTDALKEKIYTAEIFYDAPDNIANMSIGSGQTQKGYLYFIESKYEENKTISSVDLNTIKYLQISVLNDASKDADGTAHYSYEDYYLEL